MDYSIPSHKQRDPDYIFTEKFGDVYYQVHAWRDDKGISFVLPMYGTFEGLVSAICPELSSERGIALAYAEHGKCSLRAVKFLSVPGTTADIHFHAEASF